MAIQTKNPATEEVLMTFEELNEDTLEKKLAKSQEAYLSWKKISISNRADLMRALGKYLRENAVEMAKIQTIEMGKTMQSGPGSVIRCAELCDYYADNAEKMLSPEKIQGGTDNQFVRFDPIGPVLAVMPWNYPYWQVYRFAIPALMAGNTGLLKHASNVPQCAMAIEKSFTAVGFPEGVFQNLLISSALVEKVIRDERVSAVTLTGSEKAGSDVARIAGSEIKKTVLELGGNDPFIVFADADIEKAADLAVKARFLNNVGQSCISAKRFIVENKIIQKFIDAVKSKTEKLIVGDPMDEKTEIGPLASEQICNEVVKQVEESVKKGAQIVAGGRKKEGKGYYYLPTILSNVSKGMNVYDEEVFGPVISVVGFDDEEDAITIANDTRYGLGASIHTKDIERAKRIVPQIDAGNVFVNKVVQSDIKAPFGGVKRSGYGRELSSYGIREFVNIKHVNIED